MKINEVMVRPLRDSLTDRGTMPPRAAVGALLAFGSGVKDLVTLDRRGILDKGASWLLVGGVNGGVAVVEASAGSQWDWSNQDLPEGAIVKAAWYPYRAIVAIQFLAVVERDHALQLSDFNVDGRWQLTFEGVTGREWVSLDRAPSERPQAVEQLCRSLMTDAV